MKNYKTFTTMTDYGPFITKLILQLPCEVTKNDLSIDSFNVYAECRDLYTGKILMKKDKKTGIKRLLKGYPVISNVYPCCSYGNEQHKSNYVALQLKEEYLNKRIIGDVFASEWLTNYYRITQLKNFSDDNSTNGLVFDNCIEDICPQLTGWSEDISKHEVLPLRYGYYTPNIDFEYKCDLNNSYKKDKQFSRKIPIVIWLHGAGEGVTTTKVAYTGNKVNNISSKEIQKKLGGEAWVLVPQCPTVWMDDGKEKLGRSNESIYVEPLITLIEEFIENHKQYIDKNRIYIGGLSNGGFMSIKLLKEYPKFFAAAIAVCAPYFKENVTNKMIDDLKNIPIWFVHAKGDELVDVDETSLYLYNKLKEAKAENVHFSLFNKVIDLTGKYKEQDGSPKKYFNHGVWIHAFNDDCYTELDGTNVIYDGKAVTLWEWLGKQNNR